VNALQLATPLSLDTGNNILDTGAANIVGGEEGLDAETNGGDFGGEHDRARGNALSSVMFGWRSIGAAAAAANSSRDSTPSPFLSSAVKTSLNVWATEHDAAGATAAEVTVGIAAGVVTEDDTTTGPLGGAAVTVRGVPSLLTMVAGGCAGVALTVARFGIERVRTCI